MPDDFESNYKEGLRLFKAKKFETAIQNFRDSVALNDSSSEAHYFLGMSYFYAKQYDDAINQFKKAINLKPNDPTIHYDLSRVFQKKELISEEISELKESIRLDPTACKYKEDIKSVFFLCELLDEGIKYFRELIKKDSNDIDNYYCLVDLLITNHATDDAILVINQIINRSPIDEENWQRISLLFERVGNIDEALKFNRNAISLFSDNRTIKKYFLNALARKILVLSKKHLWDDAIDLYTTNSILNNKYQSLISSVAGLFGNNDDDTLLVFFLRLYQRNRENNEISSAVENILKEKNIYEEFIEDYLSFDIPITHLKLADELAIWGLTVSAVEEYQTVLKLEPDFFEAHCKIGLLLLDDRARYSDAIDELKKGLIIFESKSEPPSSIDDRDLSDYFYVLAHTQFLKKQTAEAIRLFHKGTELNPFGFHSFISPFLDSDNIFELISLEKAEEFFKNSIDIIQKYDPIPKIIEEGIRYPNRKREKVRLQLKIDLAYAYCGLGIVYEKKGRLDDAYSEIEKALGIYKEDALLFSVLAEIQKKNGQLDMAISNYREAIRIDKENAAYHDKLGDIYKECGFLDLAEQEYLDFIRLCPNMKNRYPDKIRSLRYQISKAEMTNIYTEIEQFEKNIRQLIVNKVPDYWERIEDDKLREDVTKRMEGDIQGKPYRDIKKLEPIEYFNISDYHKILYKHQELESYFGPRKNFDSQISSITKLRNPKAHSREFDLFDYHRGKAALYWFNRIFENIKNQDKEES